MVAKSYESLEILCEPFEESGRMYVNVAAPKGSKKVRWYTDVEYKRMYPNAVIVTDRMNFDARHAFGFGKEGFITLYKGYNVEEWANADRRNIYYNCTFLYYTPGRLELPKIANGIQPVRLMWAQVADCGNKMKPHEEVQKIVASLLSNHSHDSKYQGEVDEWLQKAVKIREKKTKDSRFGAKHTYTLVDAENNIYVWETGAKDYNCDTTVSLKMKVKEHKEINGEKVTVVWYCKEM